MFQYVVAFAVGCILFAIAIAYIITYKQTYLLDDNITYKVIEMRPNKYKALRILYELNHQTLDLIKKIKVKYTERLGDYRAKMDNNMVDGFAKTVYGEVSNVIPVLPKISGYTSEDNSCTECISLILQNYNPDLLEENDPIFTLGDKTFTMNFKRIAICMRKNNWEFYDFNVLMFVFLHEISHTGTHPRYLTVDGKRDNHPPMFWRVFKFVLQQAVEFGKITPINYNEKNFVTYCGVDIQNNPLYDESIKDLL